MCLSGGEKKVESLVARKVIVGVTGSIAAYKSAELVRKLKQRGAEVTAVMTPAASQFISPLTLETLSGKPVASELFPATRRPDILHISLAKWADLMVVAPATANIIGKVAAGIADELLATVIMATQAPVLFAPAMNTAMFSNPILTANISKLRQYGYQFVEPEVGELASGEEGKGRLAPIETILEAIEKLSSRSSELSGKKVLVTAGRTEEDLDPVRFLTNRSSGKMGYALASEAKSRGADVVLVSGPSHLPSPPGVRFISVRNAEQMSQKVKHWFAWCDVLLMAAAVADFRPRKKAASKIKKVRELSLELEKTPDILLEVKPLKGNKIIAGFALETEDGLANARQKLKTKGLDFIVLNTPAALGADTNQATILGADGQTEQLPQMSKQGVARRILDRVVVLLRTREPNSEKVS
ncbi:MAG: bifunctional phosphopantothenoylcysteine decarboxylase/phosphopantothenate--cysteine ligase CoaBC [Candidatus Latescibacterota bacterium]|nr:MAG: bifunctional phosphopantothenoylcysteine decarboxylase/phosphopantothenate--cysteine ligase CoaBC [Candidatus Latescibacterota bacterium]